MNSSLTNPDLALYLYALVVVGAFLLSPRWGRVRAVFTTSGQAATEK